MANTPFDELLERRTQAKDEARELVVTAESADPPRDLTDEEDAKFKELESEVKGLDRRMERLKAINDMVPPAVRKTTPEQIRQPGDPAPGPAPEKREHATIEIPSNVRRGSLKAYTRERFGPDHEKRAYTFGRAIMAHLGHDQSRRWCDDHGIEYRVHTESVNWSSGVFVMDEFDPDLIRLVESFGVFRQFARVVPMSSDVKTRNRRTGGLTAHAVGENQSGTESTMTHDQITLTAKKWMVLATISSELNEDAIISMADELMTEMAFAFAQKEDEAGFIGDGTSTYNGITGLTGAFVALTDTVANRAGQIVSANNTWQDMTLAEHNLVVGLLPQYADTPNVRWFMHKTYWGQVAQKLAYASGGNTTGDITAGTANMFLGYPVVFSQVLPKVEADDSIVAFLGDLNLAADFGDRRGTTISFSDSTVVNSVSMFENDLMAVKATTRYDINVHDVGNADSDDANKVPGPIVCLTTKAS